MFPGLGGGMASNAEEQRLMAIMQELQLTESIRTFTDVINRCFRDCVHSFRSSTLDGKEVGFFCGYFHVLTIKSVCIL